MIERQPDMKTYLLPVEEKKTVDKTCKVAYADQPTYPQYNASCDIHTTNMTATYQSDITTRHDNRTSKKTTKITDTNNSEVITFRDTHKNTKMMNMTDVNKQN